MQKTVSCPTCRRDVPVAEMVRVKGLAKTEEEKCAAEPLPQEEGEAAIKVVGSYGTKVSLFLRVLVEWLSLHFSVQNDCPGLARFCHSYTLYTLDVKAPLQNIRKS